jgi:UDP-N-acetylmuramoylalanine--D-glutamate ligase
VIKNNFHNKKIGIWGFGVVGTSALTFFDQFDCTSIEILNNKPIQLPQTRNVSYATLQDSSSTKVFFENNDVILISPGIPLHSYQDFEHKFISELDLFYHHNNISTIAITGSLGKTSITHLLNNILQKNNIHAVAAGNIGYPMLNLITQQQTKKFNTIVLELSSFQLQQSKTFAPDLAIITNVYDNHLDHHASSQEYFDAKCNIFSQQKNNQQALIPYEFAQKLTLKYPNKNFVFFSSSKPTPDELQNISHNQIMYYLDNNIIYKIHNGSLSAIFDTNQLPPITFATNWLIIITALDLQKISLQSLPDIIKQLDIPDHRLQKIASMNGSDFHNDSKSTVWQATLQAVNSMTNDKPIKLFLGGLSKGADRTPLLQALADKNIEIYAFGKEAQHLGDICKQLNIAYHVHTTLQDSFHACMHNIKEPSNILFSPAGSSYDLFDNYIHRGQFFTQLVIKHIENK